jgi:phosphoadenosine phosphosulfate reductase
MQGTLFDILTPKVNKGIERVINAYKFSQSLGLGKLWVCFSGGKDSVCLYGVVKKASEKMDIPLLDFAEFHYNVTGIDPPELVQFIKKEFPFVHRDLHNESMWQLIVRYGMPPSRWSRYCCAELKEKGGDGRFCATGVRWAESTQRKSRGEFEDYGRTKAQKKILFNDNDEDRRQMEHCIPKQKYIVNPIIDFTDEDVWHFIREENLPYCKLYDQGFKRLGCIGCPMAGGKVQQEQFAKYPKFRDAYIRAFDRMLIRRKESGLETTWQTGQEVYDWWVNWVYNDKAKSIIEEQGELF